LLEGCEPLRLISIFDSYCIRPRGANYFLKTSRATLIADIARGHPA